LPLAERAPTREDEVHLSYYFNLRFGVLMELAAQYGPRFTPADKVKQMAESGETFYQG
ncbi:MAG: hypothetical protein GY771_15135, partial [bacterium]|nr:hypothetical protein [bacterium]